MEIRQEVMEFAMAMEMALQEHDKDRGNSWKGMIHLQTFSRLKEEYFELSTKMYDLFMREYKDKGLIIEVQKECCDVANFAMFLFHNLEKVKNSLS